MFKKQTSTATPVEKVTIIFRIIRDWFTKHNIGVRSYDVFKQALIRFILGNVSGEQDGT